MVDLEVPKLVGGGKEKAKSINHKNAKANFPF